MKNEPSSSLSASIIDFDVWGSRGSRNLDPRRSRIGTHTACYSLVAGPDLFVFDAGRGAMSLGHAVLREDRLRRVERVHLFVSHAHLDHWEGLKDMEWFWHKGTGVSLVIYGTEQALGVLRHAYEHPAYVPLELLARDTLHSLAYRVLTAGESLDFGNWKLRTGKLNHYSGGGSIERFELDALCFRLDLAAGPGVAYLSDHEPKRGSESTELAIAQGAHLVLCDAHFGDVSDHAFGHGSQEYAATMARRLPESLLLAGHHSPVRSDADIRASFRKHGRGVSNFELAIEGSTYRWDATGQRFVRWRHAARAGAPGGIGVAVQASPRES